MVYNENNNNIKCKSYVNTLNTPYVESTAFININEELKSGEESPQ